MNWNRRTATWVGLALLVLTNAVALGGVAYNRSGVPDAVLKLGERELSPPYVWNDKGENSGLSLKLQWRSAPPAAPTRHGKMYYGDHDPGWLNAQKMRELGLDANATSKPQLFDANPSSRHRALPRDVFIVLEFNGPAYQDSVRRARAAVDAAPAESASTGVASRKEQAKVELAAQLVDTRLFAVDAGLDHAALRARYPDRTMYAIVRGRISPTRDRNEDDLGGFIDELSVDEINVPLEMRPVFEGVVARNGYDGSAPAVHFDATVMFGQRAEPWLANAARSQAAAIHP